MVDEVSGRFPFISLDKALSRAQAIFEGDKSGKPMAIPTAFELWNYSPKSSGGFQTIAAMKAYGLLEDEGNNADRRVKLTAGARRYFLDERDELRQAMLAGFALQPNLFNALWFKDKWREGIPADPVARSHLKIERGLNDQSARAALGIFKENIHFSGLLAGLPCEDEIESSPIPRDDAAGAEMRKDPPAMQPTHEMTRPAPPPAKQILFDMETLTVSGTFDNADDLQEFMDKLQKIKALMPAKPQ